MENTENQRKYIKDFVSFVVEWALKDSNTFLYIKCVKLDAYAGNNIGGGNIAILLITLATIDLLSRVYAFLDADLEDFYSKGEIEVIQECKNEIVNHQNKIIKYKKCLEKLLHEVPEEGDLKISSTKTLKRFILATSSITGIPKKKVGKLINMRHKLVHMFIPGTLIAQSFYAIPGADLRSIILKFSTEKVFSDNDVINSHALNQKLPRLRDFVLSKLKNSDEDSVKKACKFIEDNISGE